MQHGQRGPGDPPTALLKPALIQNSATSHIMKHLLLLPSVLFLCSCAAGVVDRTEDR